MKKILSERNLVVVLFIAALTIFSFAQEDAKKAEKLNHDSPAAASFLASPKQTASNISPIDKSIIATSLVK
ncbi:MAG: hypothetical protein ABI675_21210 [Chitinophagaceae bacterium]